MCLTCGCEEPVRARRVVVPAEPGHLQPNELVLIATEDALDRAEGWIGWNGQALMSLGNVWTPLKALRRIADHLIDHLAQIECRVGGEAPVPDAWRGRHATLDSDWARFAEDDFDESSARIRRLAQVMALRLRQLRADWDRPAGGEWTLRVIADHVAEATSAYASIPMPTPVAKPKS